MIIARIVGYALSTLLIVNNFNLENTRKLIYRVIESIIVLLFQTTACQGPIKHDPLLNWPQDIVHIRKNKPNVRIFF